MSPVVCLAAEVTVEAGGEVRVPVELVKELKGPLQFMTNACAALFCVDCEWHDTYGFLVLQNMGRMSVIIKDGDIVAAAWTAPIMEGEGGRAGEQCGGCKGRMSAEKEDTVCVGR